METISLKNAPINSLQVYNPKFEAMSDAEKLDMLDFENSFEIFGYRNFVYCPEVRTFFITR